MSGQYIGMREGRAGILQIIVITAISDITATTSPPPPLDRIFPRMLSRAEQTGWQNNAKLDGQKVSSSMAGRDFIDRQIDFRWTAEGVLVSLLV